MSFSELSFDSFYRAAVFTCTTVNTCISNFVSTAVFNDSFYRACSCASTAFYANILINLVHFSLLIPLINAKKPFFVFCLLHFVKEIYKASSGRPTSAGMLFPENLPKKVKLHFDLWIFLFLCLKFSGFF